ncbi:MAG: TIM barrel protein, partial [Bacteroidetes bacterium]|nr:TIM barrel protein [Bacteroidota bacterium]
MIKIGIKIGPLSDIKEFEKTIPYADFIELYGSSGFSYSFVKKYKKPVVVHAPNYGQCINYANSCKEAGNLESLTWAIKTANEFKSDKIIVHSELIESECCSIENTINFLKKNFDPRLHIENMPYSSMGHVHIGASTQDIKRIIDETGVKFCLDLSHAAEYAAFVKKDYNKVIKDFLDFRPNHFHLSDSNLGAVFDENFDEVHLNFFKGNID